MYLKQFADKIPPDDEILFEKKVNKETGVVRKIPLLLKKQAALTGDLLSEAKVSIDSSSANLMSLYPSMTTGAKRFEEITGSKCQKEACDHP